MCERAYGSKIVMCSSPLMDTKSARQRLNPVDRPKEPPMHRYPTLALIDRACDGHAPAFCRDPYAPDLERRVRELADEYWGDHVWLTGAVPRPAFEVVRAALERERHAWNLPVTLLIERESPVPDLDVMMEVWPMT